MENSEKILENNQDSIYQKIESLDANQSASFDYYLNLCLTFHSNWANISSILSIVPVHEQIALFIERPYYPSFSSHAQKLALSDNEFKAIYYRVKRSAALILGIDNSIDSEEEFGNYEIYPQEDLINTMFKNLFFLCGHLEYIYSTRKDNIGMKVFEQKHLWILMNNLYSGKNIAKEMYVDNFITADQYYRYRETIINTFGKKSKSDISKFDNIAKYYVFYLYKSSTINFQGILKEDINIEFEKILHDNLHTSKGKLFSDIYYKSNKDLISIFTGKTLYVPESSSEAITLYKKIFLNLILNFGSNFYSSKINLNSKAVKQIINSMIRELYPVHRKKYERPVYLDFQIDQI